MRAGRELLFTLLLLPMLLLHGATLCLRTGQVQSFQRICSRPSAPEIFGMFIVSKTLQEALMDAFSSNAAGVHVDVSRYLEGLLPHQA